MSKEQTWRKRILAFERSGLSAVAWCRRTNVPLSSLGRWRSRLAASTEPSLLPILMEVPAAAAVVEISVGRVQVRVPSSVDADWLIRLILGMG